MALIPGVKISGSSILTGIVRGFPNLLDIPSAIFADAVLPYVEPNNPRVVSLANQLTTPRSMFEWVRDNIEYVPEAVEHFQRPDETLDRKAGDCEDNAILLASLLSAKGYRNRFKVIAWPLVSQMHIYNQIYDGGRWVDADASNPDSCLLYTSPSPRD